MHFRIDWIALILSGALGIMTFLIRNFLISRFPSPHLLFSNVAALTNSSAWRVKLTSLPKWLYYAALFCFMAAFIDPHFISEHNKIVPPTASIISTEGLAIYLVLDQSGSMAQKVPFKNPKGQSQEIAKIDLLKQITEKFIVHQSDDLIGLIFFARIPFVASPLTLDHATLIAELNKMEVVKKQQEDGTSLGYAIFKAANLIAATRRYAEELGSANHAQYTIKSAIIIAVTDGVQNASDLDKGNRWRTMELEEAAEFAKSQNVHLYIINIDPAFSTQKYAPHRRQMQKMADLTGGRLYLATEEQDLKQIYANINQLEKSQIPQLGETSTQIRVFSFYPYFILAGIACFFLGCLLETLYFKVIP